MPTTSKRMEVKRERNQLKFTNLKTVKLKILSSLLKLEVTSALKIKKSLCKATGTPETSNTLKSGSKAVTVGLKRTTELNARVKKP
jgi:hypothetical protein